MDPDSRPEPPDDRYAQDLKERIVREAKGSAGDWSHGPRHPFATPRLVLGLTILMAGLLLALDNLGLVDSSWFFRYWPLAFVILGVIKLSSPPGQRQGGVFWVIVGAVLLAFTSGQMTFQRLWAVLLIFIGGSIAWRALRPRPPRADPTSGVDMMAILGGSSTRNSSTDFRGGQALAFMGGCEIDLRKASIAQDEAVLDIFAFWGGIAIKVPEEWQVVNRANAFLGAVENKTYSAPGATQRLLVTGTVIMGGAEVKN
jgi:predicted membrane protein